MNALIRIETGLIRALLLVAAVVCAGWSASASAERWLAQPFCHAVTPIEAGDTPPSAFDCSGKADNYQNASLWLRVTPTPAKKAEGGLTLVVQNTRFDRLMVVFNFSDGTVERHQVASGSFGKHAALGAQIMFNAPEREAQIESVTMRVDRLASIDLLRIRLMSLPESNRQSSALSVIIGAALTLLGIGAVYNLFFAIAARRQFAAWQSAWAACMMLWGAIWSQLILFVLPGMAGAPSAQISTAISCFAVTLATTSAVTSLSSDHVPRLLKGGTLALGGAVGLIGIPLAIMRSGPIMVLADVLALVILADLLAVALCIGWAMRSGSREARNFAGAWSMPMLMLAATFLVDTGQMLWGGGSHLLVLCAAAWQTIWISISASSSYAHLRMERDNARKAEAQAHELARRDPLTGLCNRRGFIETVTGMTQRSAGRRKPVALLLIDLDHFKQVNDRHGHDAGDRVLTCVAEILLTWEGPDCAVARLGGEEFAMLVSGLKGDALINFADHVRTEIAAYEFGPLLDGAKVTASIGVAERPDADFHSLYRLADKALYAAKHNGRDRVESNHVPPENEAQGRFIEELAEGS
ncbi:diguanylate cyclase (GGDEF)-like protein [Altererythrobacter atlanticus]|uniref:diguanylate cyclase n=1 Tax=Croceibacterium atlanticum TaxID=1267766 RepID=A0A0F7KSR4_9SPHN|nr:GGDEF domain-containing protein [Croceibacterium atlanticum]AKH42629.1 putative diguanylate cyclase YcdT [Croceibacterium atlanticum]MBB5731406.1 diguanylate cyclase (GGDEF)-like protein [Croceibacterium atlanticum]